MDMPDIHYSDRSKARKLPRQERAKFTVEAILQATAYILAGEGYAKLNTNRIAERAGVNISSLYQFFPNKEAILRALLEDHSNQISKVVEGVLQDAQNTHTSLPERGLVLIKAILAAHASNPTLHRALNEELPRSERLLLMEESEDSIEAVVASYLGQFYGKLEGDQLQMRLFILLRTVESLCHAVVIEHPDYLAEERFALEIHQLVMGYLSTWEAPSV
jgi:AcrR family transcriptional regulator